MKTRTSLVLAVVGAIVLAGGYALGPGSLPRVASAVAPGTLVFPGMAAKLKDAAEVVIASKGQTVTIAKAGDGWGLADRGGFRIQGDKLRELLTGLTELRITEARTADPAQYAKLGVDDPAGKDTTATLLRVLDAKGAPLAELIVGHRRVRTGGNVPETIYVRRPGEAQSWLAEGRLPADADPQLWFDRDISNISEAKVAGVVVHRGDETLTLGMKDGKPALLAPETTMKIDSYKLEDMFRSLETLTLTDVRKAADVPGTKLGEAEITLTDDAKIGVSVYKADKDIWATFTATGDSVKDLAARAAGWAFELGSWKEQAFVPRLEDLKAADEPAKP